MTPSLPYWREVGKGPSVVCLHSNASVSGQWRGLMERLAPRWHVLAVDSYGSGKSPDWTSRNTIRLQDEVDLIQPVLAAASKPFVLAGHSYGAAIALRAALQRLDAVRAMVLYEPTLFSLIDAQSPPPNDADGIRNTVADCAAALDSGDRLAAAARFIGYWMDDEAWNGMPDTRKAAIADSIVNARRWAHALFTEPTPLDDFRQLQMPILYMTGSRSTRSALGVADRLLTVLPNATHVSFEELGHMGPITHADTVNAVIDEFLQRL